MGQTRSAGWIGGAVVLILAILGATYFFLYQPRSDAAAATRAEASENQSRNDLLEIQVADLAAKARDMDTYLEQLDALELQVPSTAELVNLTNMIRTGAEARALSVVEVAPGVPAPVTAPTQTATTATDPTTTGTTATDGTASGSAVDQAQQTADDASAAADSHDDADSGAAAAPVTPAAPVIDGLVAIPVRIQVIGTYENALSYIDYLQTREGRLFLIGDIDATRQTETPETQGVQALHDGYLSLTINGYAYYLIDTVGVGPIIADLKDDGEANGSTTVDAGDDAEVPAPTMPSSPNNPFVPLTPSQV